MSEIEELETASSSYMPKLRSAPLMSVSERRKSNTDKFPPAREEWAASDEDEEEEEEEENEEVGVDLGIDSDMMKGFFGSDFDMAGNGVCDNHSWLNALDECKSAMEGMVKLYEIDKETFFLHGQEIKKMLDLRFSPMFEQHLEQREESD